jgi:uncharacterized membrane protein
MLRSRRGSVAVITGLVLASLIGAAALVVDLGLAFARRQSLQSATDMAALSAGWNLPATTATAVTTSATQGLSTNNFPGSAISGYPTIGLYTANPAVAPAARYVAGAKWACGGLASNALLLSSTTTSPVELGRVITTITSLSSTVSATVTRNVDAAFTVGSGLVSVSQASVMNAVLGQLLGVNLSLTAVDYNNLLNANVNGLAFSNALASQLGVTAGTYDGILSSSATVGQVLAAEATVLNTQGSGATAAVTSLDKIKQAISLAAAPTFSVGQLIAFGAWGGQTVGSTAAPAAVFGSLRVYDLLSLAAQAANGQHAITINQTGISIPGLATMSLSVTVIEPPEPAYYVFGPPCTVAHTAQIRAQLNLQMLQLLSITGIVSNAVVTLPVYVEVASGTATLVGVGCPTAAPGTITASIDAQSSAGLVDIGMVTSNAMNNFSSEPTVSPATLVNVAGILTVTGSSQAQLLPGNQTLTFSFPAPQLQTSSQEQSMSSTGSSSTPVGSTLNSGLTGTSLTITVLGLPVSGLLRPTIVNALQPILSSVLGGTTPVIDGILQALLGALGLSVGNVTVWVGGARCGPPVLVH